ncbi:MAG: hypothetical protein M1370_03045 [Bacteroidetes bacterium]|nr:hypothetical protein [Bacteroidota bacterium]
MGKRSSLVSAFVVPIACSAALLGALFAAIPALAANTIFTPGTYGYDISFPQLAGPYPVSFAAPSQTNSRVTTFGIIGVTGGRAYSQNPFLSAQYRWVTGYNSAPLTPAFYINLSAAVGTTAPNGLAGPKGNCAPSDLACVAYNFGYNAAQKDYAYATSEKVKASSWWLDIETANSWSDDTSLNDLVIQGAIDFLSAQYYSPTQKIAVGIYSNPYMWKEIAGDFAPKLPVWFTGADSQQTMPEYCSPRYSFGGGTVTAVQYWGGDTFDLEYSCP